MTAENKRSGNREHTRFPEIPVIVYNPAGISDVTLIAESARVGALGILDLEFLTIESIEKAFAELDYLGVPFGIRVDPFSSSLATLMSGETPKGLKLVILPPKPSLQKLVRKEIYKRIRNLGAKVFQEICNDSEIKACVSAGADGLIPRGYEGGGRVSTQSTFVLFQQCMKDAKNTAVYPKGGIGPRSAAALLAAGAAGVILDVQLYTLPESPLNDQLKNLIRNMGENDTEVLCLTLGRPYRCFAKVATKVVNDLKKKEGELRKEGLDQKEQYTTLKEDIVEKAAVGFLSEKPINEVIFIGQESIFAKWFEEKGSLQNALIWLMDEVKDHISKASSQKIFAANAPLAKDHGTKYPFVQGPMANITDTAEFALAVVENGALPMLAFGNLPEDITKDLIVNTKKLLKSAPFGCALIGIEANAEARDIHLAQIEELKPPFALMAGGTAGMIQRLEKAGIPSYYHSPSPQILVNGLDNGITRFIFEGMESGGHIGTLSSFVLWEQCLDVLEKRVKANTIPESIAILFAGGIHDDLSAAMVEVMCARVAGEKIKCGLHMGSVYLFTKEIIKTKSMVQLYQKMAIDTSETRITGDTVNVRARSAPTPYVDWLIDREFDRLEKGMSIKNRKLQFEADTIGALRIATRGLVFNDEHLKDKKKPVFKSVDKKTQLEKGNYLLGQMVALHDSDTTIPKIHEEIIQSNKIIKASNKMIGSLHTDSIKRLNELLELPEMTVEKQEILEKTKESTTSLVTASIAPDYYDNAIAIVGMGAVFPNGVGVDNFWKGILEGVDACVEIPEDRWDWKLYYHPDKENSYTTYSKIGGFIQNFKFDPFEFKILPAVSDQLDEFQKYALVATKEALTDAGLYQKKITNNPRMGIITANVMGGDSRDEVNIKVQYKRLVQLLENTDASKKISKELWEKLIQETQDNINEEIKVLNEDTLPGSLGNLASGRLANIFGATGPNYISDAACASTHAAIMNAVDCLNMGRSDVMLSGSSDSVMSPLIFALFCKIGALTPDGSRPFSKGANGFLMGEGAGTLVLKRLNDAVEAKDKIYAVIKGIGASSDGKGKSITAPSPKGQALAIKRALDDAKVDPSTISFIEAHGTSTAVGDVAEFNGLQEIFNGLPKKSIGLTSVKSQIGHLKAAAGTAGLIKAALAIHHKTLPPQINFSEPNPHCEWDKSPFFVITKPIKWDRISPDVPRRCGISSFGFGGTNFHIVLEEFDEKIYKEYVKASASIPKGRRVSTPVATTQQTQKAVDTTAISNYMEEKGDLEGEVFCFSSDDPFDLLNQANATYKKAKALVDDGKRLREAWEKPSFKGRYRLAIVAKDTLHFKEQIDLLQKVGFDPKALMKLAAKGIFVGDEQQIDRGKTCVMFPGQGSQYLNMLGDLKSKYKIVQDTFDELDETMLELVDYRLSDIIFADVKFGTSEYDEAASVLTQTENNQPAMLTSDIALFKILLKLGIKPDIVMGHSLGEYAAAVAAGILSFKDAIYAVSVRGNEMKDVKLDDQGKMASVSAGVDEVEKVLSKIDGYVIAANKNCNVQTVVAGETQAVEEALAKFKEKGIDSFYIPVSHAFHTEVVASAKVPLRKTLMNLTIKKPVIPMLSNVTADFYPMKGKEKKVKEEILDLLTEQVSHSVEWLDEVKKAYAEGCRVFIELGPKRALTSFTYNILEDQVKKGKVFTILSNHPKKGGIVTFNEFIGSLWALGYNIKFPDLNDDSYYTKDHITAFDQFIKDVAVTAAPSSAFQGSDKVLIAPGPGADPRFAEILNRLAPSLAKLVEGVAEESLRAIGDFAPQPGEVIQVAEAETTSAYWNEVKDQLIDIVSKKTGYPKDMLEVDSELEADLGIDTVKQVELFALSRDEFKLPRDDNVNLTDFVTLRDIVNYIVTKTKPDEMISAEAETKPSGDITKDQHWTNTSEKILALISDKTGYPIDMLELESELEADLGIDTVKQVELFAMSREKFNLPRDDNVNLTDFVTITDLINYVAKMTKTDTEPVKEKVVAKEVNVDELKDRINRWVLEVDKLENLQDKNTKPLQGKTALVITAEKEEKELVEILGIKPIYATPDDIISEKTDISAAEGIINLYPLSINNNESISTIEKSCSKAVKCLYPATRTINDNLANNGFFISVTGMGGTFGLDNSVNPAHGGVAGFTKAISHEYQKSNVMVFDTNPALPKNEIFNQLLLEIQNNKLPLEIGWDGSARYKPVLRIMEPAQPSVLELKDDSKVLVTGGGSGITAEIIKGLASKSKMEIHILDIQELEKSEQAKKTIKELESLGSKVHYHKQDVLDLKGIKNITKENGPFNGIIHGAGIEISQLIMKKPQKEFNLVYDVKVKGALNLLSATKDTPLDFFMTFSSVAGRFGNRGQTDYSAANDTLNKIHGPIKKLHPNCVVKTIGWSAWAGTGMATKEAVEIVLKAGGITFIPVDVGVTCAINELTNGIEREVYYAGSVGPLDKEKIMKWNEGIHSTDHLKIATIKSIAPLIDEIVELSDDSIIATRTFDGKREKFLPDHKIFGKMVVPGVMGLEMFAEIASKLVPNKKVIGYEKVGFKNPIGVDDKPIEVKIEGKIIEKGDTDKVQITITSEAKVKGEIKVQENFTGIVLMGTKTTKPYKRSFRKLTQGKIIEKEIRKDSIYKIFFHGESFRVIKSISLIDDNQSICNYKPVKLDLLDESTGYTGKDLLTSPMQCECAFQAAGIYIIDRHKMMALPYVANNIFVHKKIGIQEETIIQTIFLERKENTFILDLFIYDLKGNLLITIKGYEMKSYMKLEDRFEDEINIPIEEVNTTWENPRIFKLKINSLSKKLDSYKKYFSAEEWDDLFTEKMTDKRKIEHLAGRLAAKSVISWKERTEQGNIVELKDINIITVKDGKPYGTLNDKKYNISISHSNEWAVVSISNIQHGIDIELIEKRDPSFEKEMSTQDEIKELKSSMKSIGLTEEVAQTMLFSAKEALLKKLGVGLSGGLKKVKFKKIKKMARKRKDEITYYLLDLTFGSKSYEVSAMILDDYIITTT
ncbi:MAG: SDR family NAD(P)-dependent oxidoreductase [Asgard group archaeon]|nr:SDR family NAD(P)-dependent oxidoreductase [Asgard group archaeon]